MNKRRKFQTIKVATDADEVCVPTLENCLNFSNNVYGTRFRFDEINNYDNLAESLGVPGEFMNHLWRTFYTSPEFIHGSKALKKSVHGIRLIANRYGVVPVITDRSETHTKEATERLFSQFHGIGKKHYCDGHNPDPSKRKTKAEVMVEEGYNILIDDSTRHVTEVSETIPLGLVIRMDKPWNRGRRYRGNVYEAQDMVEAFRLIVRWEIGQISTTGPSRLHR